MEIIGMWRTDFKIRCKSDVEKFVHGLANTHVNFDDVNNPGYYYSISKAKDGTVRFGHTRYGKDPITAPPILMDSDNLIERIYAARKSVNARFFKD